MLQGVTGNYRGIQEIAKCNMGLERLQGLQGVTRSYRRLQGATMDYRGIQGVTESYRGLQGLQGITGCYKG